MKLKQILYGLTALALLAGCSGAQPAVSEADAPTPVSVMSVGKSDISSKIIYAGQINPGESVSVSAKLAGKVKEVFFDVGDAVNQDDVLFTLDEVDLRNQIRQLESQLNIADQGVKTAQNAQATVTGGQYSSQILQLETAVDNCERQVESARLGLRNSEIAVDNAKIALDNAQETYNNVKKLYESGSASKSEFDRAELGYKQAQAGVEQALVGNNSAQVSLEQAQLALRQAKESLELMIGELTDENLQKAKLGVEQATASRESARIQLDIALDALDDSAVKAPISGVISGRSAKAGEYTSTQMPAFSIVQLDTVTVNVRVSELLINLLSPGQAVEVYVSTVSDSPITGRIKTISPAADMTSTYPIEIEIDNPGHLIKPGMFAEAHFVRAASQNTVVLPRNTVMEDENAKFVYIDDNGTAKKTPVTTGIDNGQEIEVLTGLEQGDRVIVKGQSYLHDGDRINVVE